MRTNSSGVTEKAEFNVDKEKYDSGYDHIFNREKCKCEECEKDKMPFFANDPIEEVECVKCKEKKKRVFASLSKDGRNIKKYNDETGAQWNAKACPDCYRKSQKKRALLRKIKRND